MIYDSIYKIPSRLFFDILETGNYVLLDTKKKALKLSEKMEELTESNTDEFLALNKELESELKKLESIWFDLEEADQKLSKNPKTEKFLNTSKLIESLKCQQKKVEIAISYLKIQDDEELKKLLIADGFEFTGDNEKDLARIERLNRDINVKLAKLELQLPKQTETKQTPFDELVVGYGTIVGQTFRTNEITQSEFRALEQSVKSKIESLAKNKDGR